MRKLPRSPAGRCARLHLLVPTAGLLLAVALHAAEDAGPVSLNDPASDLTVVADSGVSSRHGVVAGLAATGDATTWVARVIAFSAKTGSEVWRDEIDTPGSPDYFADVDVTKKHVCVAGIVGDAGDGGLNALVRCYDARSGAALWTHEYEHPVSDTENVAGFVGTEATDDINPSVRIAGKNRVFFTIQYFDGAALLSRTILFDLKTGTPL